MTEQTSPPSDEPFDQHVDTPAHDAPGQHVDRHVDRPADRLPRDAPGQPHDGPLDRPGREAVPDAFHRQPYSFVRRGDRLTARRQKAWDTWAPTRVLEVPRVHTDTSVHPDHEFHAAEAFGRDAPLVVEIGSGLGEAVVAAAAGHPEQDYLAVEVYKPGIADLLLKAGQAGVDNIRVVQANAPEVLEHMLAPASVRELWVFFPDPWHKTRHHKRRLVSPAFAQLAARVVEPAGLWRLATDWQEYALLMREVLDSSPDFDNVHPGPTADDQHPDVGWAPRWAGRILTSFERKAQEAGRVPRDLTYRRLS